MKKSISVIFLVLFLSFFVSSEINELAPVKQGECKIIPQVCGTCTYINISVQGPNSTILITNEVMSSVGGGLWTYEFCNTTNLGRYDIFGSGDLEGVDTGFDVLYFHVNPTGASNITDAQSNIVGISMIVMILVGGFFFFLFSKAEGIAWKIVFGGSAATILIMCVLYSMVLIDQNLGVFSTLVTSYSSFWMVVKSMLGIAMLTLLLYAGFRAFKLWQIKRGFADD